MLPSSRRAKVGDDAPPIDALIRKRLAKPRFDSIAAVVVHYELVLAEQERQSDRLRAAHQQSQLALFKVRALNAEANDGVRRQTEFLALVSHELRNPLASLSTAGAIMGTMALDDARLVALQRVIARQTLHASRLIEDLLDLSRTKTGKLSLRLRPVDLREVIELAVDSCTPAMKRRSQQFSLEVVPDELRVQGDLVRLVQVLCNLLDNASKYTPELGVISLRATTDEGFIELRVADSGIGMRAETVPALFDVFVQDPAAVSFNASGLGIGLAVVRELVVAHGGTVNASSPGTGQGSEFVVRLARLDAPGAAASGPGEPGG
jgi:signal transduction histidine kinase